MSPGVVGAMRTSDPQVVNDKANDRESGLSRAAAV